MLIDNYLKNYGFSEKHTIQIAYPKRNVTDAFYRLELKDICYRLCKKGVKDKILHPNDLFYKSFILNRFIPLAIDATDDEIVVGLVGRFWQNKTIGVAPENFETFQKQGFAKLVWNFKFEAIDSSQTCVSTETRIECCDKKALRIFRCYWFLLKPFSGLLRQYILNRIEKKVILSQK